MDPWKLINLTYARSTGLVTKVQSRAQEKKKSISTEDVSQSPVNSNDSPKQIVQQCDDTSVSDITDNTLNSNDIHEKSNTSSHEVFASDNSDIYQDSVIPISPAETILMSLNEKEKNEFLDKKHRETISKETIQKIKEKKLRDQETIITSQNTVPIISREQGFIQEISPSIQDYNFIFSNHVTEISLTQNSNQVSKNHVSDITILSVSSKTLLNLAILYRKACDAEKQAIKANQDEILCWYHYVIEFDNQVKDIMKNEQVEYTDEQDNSSDDQDLDLREASVNASTGTENFLLHRQ
ncbi:16088_t:CDS:2 [Acaulospora morrowiae]|uniref:16088_t:CDS:1 n=1 Tax=Acaulospora morrowiae TaxID=94023 RepID=A0A9N9BKJ0_9GLOM|nr:16088_t:CDS:2 [Acaulospora morrowiae]